MNRTILFRGKRVDNGEWVEGLLFYSHGTGVYKITTSDGWLPSYSNPDAGECSLYFDIVPETVGQFTGLLDKNGKRIFEGDIVTNLHSADTCVVVFEKETAMFLAQEIGDEELGFGIEDVISVIGNIHDNQ